jgi:transcription termination factor NusB
MKKELTITLGEGVTVTVKEFRVKDIIAVIAQFKKLPSMDVEFLLMNHYADFEAFVKPYVSTDKDLQELTLSEFEAVFKGLIEVNQSFFEKLNNQLMTWLGTALGKFVEPALLKIMATEGLAANLPPPVAAQNSTIDPSPSKLNGTLPNTTLTDPASGLSNGGI